MPYLYALHDNPTGMAAEYGVGCAFNHFERLHPTALDSSPDDEEQAGVVGEEKEEEEGLLTADSKGGRESQSLGEHWDQGVRLSD